MCDDDDDDDDADDDRSSCWPQKETHRQLGRGQKKKTNFFLRQADLLGH